MPTASNIRVRRVRLALAMIALAALSTFRLPIRAMHEAQSASSSDGIDDFLRRCRRLEAHLPARGRIGYRAPSSHAQTHSSVRGDRLQLMRYALAPRVVEQFWDHDIVIFDADDQALAPSPAESHDWRLVADLQDGMKVFRTFGGQ